MNEVTMRKGDAMATIEVVKVDGKYQDAVKIVQASAGTYSHFHRQVEHLSSDPEEAYRSAKSLAAIILNGL